jgi:uncharacterized coiled-coil protein SlyX
MAAILKLRRGTSFTSLQESELFYNTSLETILIGDGSGSNTSSKVLVKLNESNSGSLHLLSDITGSHISASGDITASNLTLSGDADIVGNITLGGSIFLGDEDSSTDNININASVSGSLIPATTSVFTLGTDTKKYLDLRVVNATIDNINLPGSGILSSSVTDFTDYSQSVDNRLDVEEAKSVTLETVTSSLDTRLDIEEAKSATLSPLTASYDSRLSNLQITSASHDGRLDVEEAKSTTLETVTSSLDVRLDVEEAKSVTLETVSSSFDNRLDNLELDSASQDGRLDNLELESASQDNRLDIEEAKSTTLETVTSSLDTRLDNVESYTSSFATDTVTLTNKTINGSNNTLTVDISRDTNLAVSDTTEVNMILTDDTISAELIGGVVSGSSQINADTVTNFDSNVKTKLDDETVISGSSQVDYSSISGINNNIISASSDTSQVDMIINGGSISANLKGGVVSGSIQILGGSNILSSSNENFNGFSSSVDSRLDTIEGPLSTSLDSRLDSLETDTHTHSNKAQLDTINQNLATTSDVTFNTGSFTGDMTVTGNLTVLGSATEISSTELKIEDKLITVASGSSDSAAADGAGIEIDGANKSLKWDHNTSQFVLDAKVSSSVGFKGEGGELTGIDTDQVTEGSSLYYTDTRVKTKLNTENVHSGSFLGTSTTTNLSEGTNLYWTEDRFSSSLDNRGVISGSSQVNADSITNFDSNVKAKLDAETVVSGSTQVTDDLDLRYLEIGGDSVFSGSSQVDADQTTGWVTDVRTQIDNIGLVSGSSQVDADTITNFDSNVKAKLDVETVVSGSSQIDIHSTDGYVANEHIDHSSITIGSGKGLTGGGTIDTNRSLSLDTGSVHFSEGVKKRLDVETVISGSSQVNADTITNFDSNVKAKLDAETVVSGSTFASNHQGSFTSSINGLATNVDLGLNTNDSPTFNSITLSSISAGGSSDFDALFDVSGEFKKRTIGTAAFLNVSASIADDPNSIPTTKAVNDALVAAGAGDITAVNSTTTISPSTTGLIHTEEGTEDGGAYGNTGNIVIAIDTGSAHFTDGVKLKLDADGVISGSSQLYSDLDSRYNNELGEGVVSGSSQVVLNDADKTGFDTADVSEGTNLYYTDTRVKTKLDADGVISGSSQTLEILNSLNTYTGSAITATAIQDSRLDQLSTETGSISTEQGIQDQRLSAIEADSGSYLKTVDISSDTNLAVSDTTEVNMILTDDTLSAELIGGVVSSSLQITITESQISDLDHYTDSDVKLKLDAETVISGSSQVQINSVTGFSAVSTSLDDRLDTLEGDIHENVLTFGDTANIDLIRTTNTITANIKGGIFSGSSQVSLGGDVTGTADDVNVGSVQGVALTSGEVTQLATIGTTTISATQWGYLGGSDQNVKTNSDVSFASASLSNVVISGNLTVLGDAVELGVSELTIEDKTITVASGSADSAAADGAGIIIAGADESITWNHANTRFNISDDIHVTGTIKATDDIIAFASSDRELKNNILPITNPLEKINKIGGYSFDWNEDKQHIYNGKDYGVIAQEIEQVLPELVQTRENGYKAVKYDKLVSLLIEGIKELSNEVEELKRKIQS